MTSASERPRRRALTGCCLALACLLLAAPSAAEEPAVDAETRTAARELARAGADAYSDGDYATALDQLQRAYQLVPAPSIALWEARALARLGRLVEALDRYEETRVTPLEQDAPQAFIDAVRDAGIEAEELRARVPRLTIRVHPPGDASLRPVVSLDGKPVPAALLGVKRPLDPGVHRIVASAPGTKTVTRDVQLDERGNTTLELDLLPVAPSRPQRPPSAAPAPEVTPPPSTGPGSPSWLPWSSLGLGAAGLATSGVVGVMALDKKSTLDGACDPGCPPNYRGDLEDYRRYRTVSYVSLAVGTVALGAGGYLLFTGGDGDRSVSAVVGPGSLRLKTTW